MKAGKNKPGDRKRLTPTLAAFRSSITNGSSLFVGVDERSSYCRRFRDVLAAHISDLGGQGVCSESECSLARRVATLTVALERLESKFAENDGEACATDLLTYQRIASCLRRCLETLAGGLARRPKPVESLASYLEAKYSRDAEEALEAEA